MIVFMVKLFKDISINIKIFKFFFFGRVYYFFFFNLVLRVL